MFPAEIVPVSIFLSALGSHLLAVVMLFSAVLVILHQASFSLLLLPLFFALLGLLAIGISWISSSLHVYLRDTAQVMSVILTFWFWLTPIFIPERDIPGWARPVLLSNPLTYVVRCYRAVLLSARAPALHDVLMLAAISLSVFVLGGLFFRQMKRGFADVL